MPPATEKKKAYACARYKRLREAAGFSVSPTGRHRLTTVGPNPLKREELAWAAGFVDGEGCFYLQQPTGKDKFVRYCFSLGQVDRRALDRFVLAIGFGNVLGPHKPSNNGKWYRNARPAHRLRITGFERVQTVMALLWTWLGPVKRQQATSILYTVGGV